MAEVNLSSISLNQTIHRPHRSSSLSQPVPDDVKLLPNPFPSPPGLFPPVLLGRLLASCPVVLEESLFTG
jgi:hypothetical protein